MEFKEFASLEEWFLELYSAGVKEDEIDVIIDKLIYMRYLDGLDSDYERLARFSQYMSTKAEALMDVDSFMFEMGEDGSYINPDSPTTENHENLEARVSNIEKRMSDVLIADYLLNKGVKTEDLDEKKDIEDKTE